MNQNTLTFLQIQNTHYIYETKASVVLVNKSLNRKPITATLIAVEDAYKSLSLLLKLVIKINRQKGIDSLAFIAPSAKIGKTYTSGPFATLKKVLSLVIILKYILIATLETM